MYVVCFPLLRFVFRPLTRVQVRDSDEDGVEGPTIRRGVAKDDGYVSPDFDLPSASGHEDSPPPKKQKFDKKNRAGAPTSLGDEEALALALLRGR